MEKEYKGWLVESSWGEGDDILYLKGDENPLAELIEEDMDEYGYYLTVRYLVVDKERTKEEAEEGFIKEIMGDAHANVGSAYSEYTGYLWTDEEIKVGGHDLIEELHGFVGKYLILEIEYSKEQK